MSSPDDTPGESRPWRLLDAPLAFAGGALFSSVAFVAVVAFGGDAISAGTLFGIAFPAQAVGMIGTVALLARRRSPWRSSLGWSFQWSDAIGVPIGAGIQIAASVAMVFIVEMTGLEIPVQEVVDRATAAAGYEWVLVVFSVVVLAPVSEEIVFRGVALRALEHRFGRRIAVVGSALFFMAIHVLLDPGALFGVPVFLLLGIILGNEVMRTGRLGRAIAIHAGFNAITILALVAVQ